MKKDARKRVSACSAAMAAWREAEAAGWGAWHDTVPDGGSLLAAGRAAQLAQNERVKAAMRTLGKALIDVAQVALDERWPSSPVQVLYLALARALPKVGIDNDSTLAKLDEAAEVADFWLVEFDAILRRKHGRKTSVRKVSSRLQAIDVVKKWMRKCEFDHTQEGDRLSDRCGGACT